MNLNDKLLVAFGFLLAIIPLCFVVELIVRDLLKWTQ